MSNSEEQDEKIFPATVVKVINDYKVAINRGESDGIKLGQRFLIYKIDEQEIIDPETGENLGRLEIVRGKGKVVHLQEKLATIESTDLDKPKKTVIKRSPVVTGLFGSQEETYQDMAEILPFDEAERGDKAKPI